MASDTSAQNSFEKQIWDAACVLRGNMDASEYKSVVLGLINIMVSVVNLMMVKASESVPFANYSRNLAFKDVRLGIEMCESFGQRVPMMSRAREVFAATAEKYGEENFTATFKML